VKAIKYVPRVGHYLAPYWKLASVSAVMMIVAGGVALLVPWPLKILIDNILGKQPVPPWLHSLIGEHPPKSLWTIIVVVGSGFLIVILQNALTVLDNYVNVCLEQNMVLDFRSDLFRHAERLSLAFHDQKRSGMLIYAINNQGDAVARSVMTIPPLAHSVVTLVGMFWIVFTMNHTLALMSLVVIPFLYYSVSHYVKHVQVEVQRVLEMEGQSLSIVDEAITMLRVLVAFGRED
jgi:ABC-type multidrug transport system fused ATPase/permease subunit